MSELQEIARQMRLAANAHSIFILLIAAQDSGAFRDARWIQFRAILERGDSLETLCYVFDWLKDNRRIHEWNGGFPEKPLIRRIVGFGRSTRFDVIAPRPVWDQYVSALADLIESQVEPAKLSGDSGDKSKNNKPFEAAELELFELLKCEWKRNGGKKTAAAIYREYAGKHDGVSVDAAKKLAQRNLARWHPDYSGDA